jgi:hypothetical protein
MIDLDDIIANEDFLVEQHRNDWHEKPPPPLDKESKSIITKMQMPSPFNVKKTIALTREQARHIENNLVNPKGFSDFIRKLVDEDMKRGRK